MITHLTHIGAREMCFAAGLSKKQVWNLRLRSGMTADAVQILINRALRERAARAHCPVIANLGKGCAA